MPRVHSLLRFESKKSALIYNLRLAAGDLIALQSYVDKSVLRQNWSDFFMMWVIKVSKHFLDAIMVSWTCRSWIVCPCYVF